MDKNTYVAAGRWLRITSEDFLGPFASSPDGRYVLAWENARLDAATGAVSRRGRFLFLADDAIRIRADVRKVLTGAVSDAGTFVVACGPKEPGRRQATLYVIRRDGKVLIKHSIGALLGASGISPDGRFALCQATVSDDEAGDGGVLLCFDVRERSLLWKKNPDFGWASRFEIDPDGGEVRAFVGRGDRGGCHRLPLGGQPVPITELKPSNPSGSGASSAGPQMSKKHR